MSYPQIPDMKPDIDIDRVEIIDMMLASIAMEEIGLAHIINSEAEKIQYVLGTLEDGKTIEKPPTITELKEINRTVERTLRAVIKNQMLLQFKLEDVMEITAESTVAE